MNAHCRINDSCDETGDGCNTAGPSNKDERFIWAESHRQVCPEAGSQQQGHRAAQGNEWIDRPSRREDDDCQQQKQWQIGTAKADEAREISQNKPSRNKVQSAAEDLEAEVCLSVG